MKVVLLAGGFGSRISEESVFKPKPKMKNGKLGILNPAEGSVIGENGIDTIYVTIPFNDMTSVRSASPPSRIKSRALLPLANSTSSRNLWKAWLPTVRQAHRPTTTRSLSLPK